MLMIELVGACAWRPHRNTFPGGLADGPYQHWTGTTLKSVEGGRPRPGPGHVPGRCMVIHGKSGHLKTEVSLTNSGQGWNSNLGRVGGPGQLQGILKHIDEVVAVGGALPAGHSPLVLNLPERLVGRLANHPLRLARLVRHLHALAVMRIGCMAPQAFISLMSHGDMHQAHCGPP